MKHSDGLSEEAVSSCVSCTRRAPLATWWQGRSLRRCCTAHMYSTRLYAQNLCLWEKDPVVGIVDFTSIPNKFFLRKVGGATGEGFVLALCAHLHHFPGVKPRVKRPKFDGFEPRKHGAELTPGKQEFTCTKALSSLSAAFPLWHQLECWRLGDRPTSLLSLCSHPAPCGVFEVSAKGVCFPG